MRRSCRQRAYEGGDSRTPPATDAVHSPSLHIFPTADG